MPISDFDRINFKKFFNQGRLNIVAEPALEPVTLNEVKNFLRIELTETIENDLLNNLIETVRQEAELFTGMRFITQEWQIFWDFIPNGFIRNVWWDGVREGSVNDLTKGNSIFLPFPPLQSVTHIKFFDDQDVATTLATTEFQVSTYKGLNANNGRITFKDGVALPTPSRNADAVEIQFIAGYGDNPEDMPYAIRQGILEEINFRYENSCLSSGDGS